MKIKIFDIALCCCALAFASCTSDYGTTPDSYRAAYAESDGGAGVGQGPGGGVSGKVTAGEWRDLDNWSFWSVLMTSTQSDQQGNDFTGMSSYWRFYTNRRVAVHVIDEQGNDLCDVKVRLDSDGRTVWNARTDNLGRAEAWVGLFDSFAETGELAIYLNGVKQESAPELTDWESSITRTNEYKISSAAPQSVADILFIVDATGSMSDEIDFLKADLMDILQKGSAMEAGVTFRTGALFYRDVEDDYLTKVSPFTNDFSTTINFISQQEAAGGGDYPEAVHTALEVSLSELSWSDSAKARLAFMLLDAPPHQSHQGVIESLQGSIKAYAEKGIKLIPVASSGVDKNTEFALRFFAIATGGTYVFITNDSQIGNDHIQATVGNYDVELLNDLLVRLIAKYIQ